MCIPFRHSSCVNNYISLFIIAICLPFILWAVCDILPTFDDFNTLQSPQFIPWLSAEGILPNDSFWRPWDFLFGCLLGRFPVLFPAFNHVCILLGHTMSTILLFKICTQLKFGSLSTNIATLFFFFSPATLGATLACDGLNQTYAQFWGLLALWCYMNKKYWLWPLLVFVAALSKENGLAWAIVPPIFAYAFQLINRKQALRDCGIGIVVAIVYFVLRLSLSISDNINNEYTDMTMMGHLKDLLQLLVYTWVPLDYMSAVYAPTRNLTIVLITALMSLPFLLILASRWRMLLTRQLLLLMACYFILVSPHLITLVSIMHNYAALSIAAIIVAALLSDKASNPKPSTSFLKYAFALFLAAALFTDVHHYVAARESGLLGKRLAEQVLKDGGQPLQKVMVINIDDPDELRYSNFCVRPVDAFGWGLSVRHYSGYTWNPFICEATFDHYDPVQVKATADSALHAGCEAVWIAGHKADSVAVIKPTQTPSLPFQ